MVVFRGVKVVPSNLSCYVQYRVMLYHDILRVSGTRTQRIGCYVIDVIFPEDSDFSTSWVNTLRPRQNVRHFPDDIFKCIFLDENEWISIKISLKFVPKVRINNTPALVWIMAWRRSGDKPLSEPMVVSFLAHICVTRPQWVKSTMHILFRQLYLFTAIQHRCIRVGLPNYG